MGSNVNLNSLIKEPLVTFLIFVATNWKKLEKLEKKYSKINLSPKNIVKK